MRDVCIPSLIQFGQQTAANCLSRFTTGAIVAVDATCGNGHDTLFLAGQLAKRAAPDDLVVALDIQDAAIASTRALLQKHGQEERVRMLLRGHEHLADILSDLGVPAQRHCAIVMYNLGYLPRSDKKVTTQSAQTLCSLDVSSALLAPGGLILVHAYGGHAGGLEELNAVRGWFQALHPEAWHAVDYGVCNKPRNPEALLLAVKKEHSHGA